MRRRLIVATAVGLALLALTPQWVHSQTATTPEQQVKKVEEERRTAVLHNDVKTLARLYAQGMTTIDIVSELWSFTARLTHVWVRRQGQWQLVARQATRIGNTN